VDKELIEAIATLTKEVQEIKRLLSGQNSAQWLSVSEFSKRSGLTREQVYNWIKAAELGRNPLKDGIHYRKLSGGGDRHRYQIDSEEFLKATFNS
jgi:hypothetical protein